MSAAAVPRAMLAEDLAGFTHDPLNAVRYGFPWGEGELEGIKGPRKWQCEVLEEIREHLENPATRFTPCLISISSGHGPGKSTLAALVSWWGMSTFEQCRVRCTANTGTQLETITQPEFAKWFRLAINADWFDVNVKSIKVQEDGLQDRWRADFVPWSLYNPQSFAGLHNARKRLIVIGDEASGIADIVLEVAQGAWTDEYTEIICLLLGNPHRNVGYFYETVFGKRRHRWKHRVIDSRDVEGTNKAEIAEWLRECDGNEDSDYFRVRARGLPPRAGSGQFIELDRIHQAQKRPARAMPDDPLIAGVDFAWGGEDDNVVRFRRGLDGRSILPVRIKGEFTRDPAVMTQKLAGLLAREFDGQKIAIMFIDSAGIAGPILARLRALGFQNVVEVNFGGFSPDPKCAYKRDQMWNDMREWLLNGAIDADPGLEADLSGPLLVSEREQRIKLESKDVMKKRLKKLGKSGDSPDDADALALTFAMPVAPAKPKPQTRTPHVSAWS